MCVTDIFAAFYIRKSITLTNIANIKCSRIKDGLRCHVLYHYVKDKISWLCVTMTKRQLNGQLARSLDCMNINKIDFVLSFCCWLRYLPSFFLGIWYAFFTNEAFSNYINVRNFDCDFCAIFHTIWSISVVQTFDFPSFTEMWWKLLYLTVSDSMARVTSFWVHRNWVSKPEPLTL